MSALIRSWLIIVQPFDLLLLSELEKVFSFSLSRANFARDVYSENRRENNFSETRFLQCRAGLTKKELRIH